LFPLLTTAALLWVAYKSLNPLPPSPIRWAAVGASGWLALGVVVLAVRRRRGADDWASDARRAMHERPGVGSQAEAEL